MLSAQPGDADRTAHPYSGSRAPVASGGAVGGRGPFNNLRRGVCAPCLLSEVSCLCVSLHGGSVHGLRQHATGLSAFMQLEEESRELWEVVVGVGPSRISSKGGWGHERLMQTGLVGCVYA